MKKILFLFLFASLLAACKKDLGACKTDTELTGRTNTVDAASLNAPELRDTLNKYPQLQLYRFSTYNSGWAASCHVFYKDLMIFSDDYVLNKNNFDGKLSCYDTIWTKPLSLSLTPGMSHQDAIRQAKRFANFDHTCISYRLGLYNINHGMATRYSNYVLVWKIQGDGGYPYVLLEANTGYLVLKSAANTYVLEG